MPYEIAKLTEEAEIAQAGYEALLNVYELSSGIEKIRLVSRLTSALMRRDETLFAVIAALKAPSRMPQQR
jgi:Xaa-Pro aminopeptidase